MTESTVDTLARLTLFADLSRAEVEAVSHSFDEQVFAEGERVLRLGLGLERLRDPGRRGRSAYRRRRAVAARAR